MASRKRTYLERFADRRAILASKGYHIDGPHNGATLFVNEAGTDTIDVEDVLAAGWSDWNRILDQASVNG